MGNLSFAQALGAGELVSDANMIINGGFEVSQLNGTSAITVGGGSYQVDQWQVAKNGTMVCTAQQVADAPSGFTNSLKITVGTAEASIAAGDYTIIYTPIEGYRTSRLAFGTASAQYVSVGFWTKIHRVGTYSAVIKNSALDRSYPFSFTQNVADTWEYKTATIPGDVTGTWIGNTSGIGLLLIFAVAAGSTFTSTVNTWDAGSFLGATGTTNGVAATSDVFQITGVSLIPGQLPIPQSVSSLIKRSFDDEFKLCQRYWEKSYNYATAVGTGSSAVGAACATASAGTFEIPVRYQVTKRAVPTITSYSWTTGTAGKAFDNSAGGDVVGTGTAVGETNAFINGSGSSVGLFFAHFTVDARM